MWEWVEECVVKERKVVMRVSVVDFFFNDTATTEIYTLSLHGALPISLALIAIGSRTARALARLSKSIARMPSTIASSS